MPCERACWTTVSVELSAYFLSSSMRTQLTFAFCMSTRSLSIPAVFVPQYSIGRYHDTPLGLGPDGVGVGVAVGLDDGRGVEVAVGVGEEPVAAAVTETLSTQTDPVAAPRLKCIDVFDWVALAVNEYEKRVQVDVNVNDWVLYVVYGESVCWKADCIVRVADARAENATSYRCPAVSGRFGWDSWTSHAVPVVDAIETFAEYEP